MGDLVHFFAIIWQQIPELSSYWADIDREGVVKAYSILLITQPIFIQFWWNLYTCVQETSSYK